MLARSFVKVLSYYIFFVAQSASASPRTSNSLASFSSTGLAFAFSSPTTAPVSSSSVPQLSSVSELTADKFSDLDQEVRVLTELSQFMAECISQKA